jgi:hypothetical protein
MWGTFAAVPLRENTMARTEKTQAEQRLLHERMLSLFGQNESYVVRTGFSRLHEI